jgi:hypothetical protein
MMTLFDEDPATLSFGNAIRLHSLQHDAYMAASAGTNFFSKTPCLK